MQDSTAQKASILEGLLAGFFQGQDRGRRRKARAEEDEYQLQRQIRSDARAEESHEWRREDREREAKERAEKLREEEAEKITDPILLTLSRAKKAGYSLDQSLAPRFRDYLEKHGGEGAFKVIQDERRRALSEYEKLKGEMGKGGGSMRAMISEVAGAESGAPDRFKLTEKELERLRALELMATVHNQYPYPSSSQPMTTRQMMGGAQPQGPEMFQQPGAPMGAGAPPAGAGVLQQQQAPPSAPAESHVTVDARIPALQAGQVASSLNQGDAATPDDHGKAGLLAIANVLAHNDTYIKTLPPEVADMVWLTYANMTGGRVPLETQMRTYGLGASDEQISQTLKDYMGRWDQFQQGAQQFSPMVSGSGEIPLGQEQLDIWQKIQSLSEATGMSPQEILKAIGAGGQEAGRGGSNGARYRAMVPELRTTR